MALTDKLSNAIRSGKVNVSVKEAKKSKVKTVSRFADDPLVTDALSDSLVSGNLKLGKLNESNNPRDQATKGIGVHDKPTAMKWHKNKEYIDFFEPKNGDKKYGRIHSIHDDHYTIKDTDGNIHKFKYSS